MALLVILAADAVVQITCYTPTQSRDVSNLVTPCQPSDSSCIETFMGTQYMSDCYAYSWPDAQNVVDAQSWCKLTNHYVGEGKCRPCGKFCYPREKEEGEPYSLKPTFVGRNPLMHGAGDAFYTQGIDCGTRALVGAYWKRVGNELESYTYCGAELGSKGCRPVGIHNPPRSPGDGLRYWAEQLNKGQEYHWLCDGTSEALTKLLFEHHGDQVKLIGVCCKVLEGMSTSAGAEQSIVFLYGSDQLDRQLLACTGKGSYATGFTLRYCDGAKNTNDWVKFTLSCSLPEADCPEVLGEASC